MTTYPIALELTVWFDLGLNQYEVAIDETSRFLLSGLMMSCIQESS